MAVVDLNLQKKRRLYNIWLEQNVRGPILRKNVGEEVGPRGGAWSPL